MTALDAVMEIEKALSLAVNAALPCPASDRLAFIRKHLLAQLAGDELLPGNHHLAPVLGLGVGRGLDAGEGGGSKRARCEDGCALEDLHLQRRGRGTLHAHAAAGRVDGARKLGAA